MKIQTHCTHCNTPYTLDFQLIGRKAKCRECGEEFLITEDVDNSKNTGEKKVAQKSPDLEIKPNKNSFLFLNPVFITLIILGFLASFGNIAIGFIFIILAVLSYYFRYVTYEKSFYTLTDRKLIYKTGTIVTDNTVEINLDKITLVKSKLGFIQHKIFKTGNLLVKTAGSSNSKVHFCHIDNTMEIYDELQVRMKKNGFHLEKDKLVQTAKPHILGIFGEIGSQILSTGLVILYFFWGAVESVQELGELDFLSPIFSAGLSLYALIAIAFFIFSYLDLKRRKYEVFSDSIFYSEGFLTKNYAFIPMENISDTQNTQSFLSKVLGLHDVEISSGGANNKVVFKNMVGGEKMMESIKYLKDQTIMGAKDEIIGEVKKQSLIDFKDKIEEPLDYDKNFTAEYQMNIARSMAGIILMVIILSPLLFFAGETLFVIFIVIVPAVIKIAIAIIATKFFVTPSSIEWKYDFFSNKHFSFSVEKITKITMSESIIDKVFGTCTIKFYSIGSGSAIVFKNIKKSTDLYEKLLAKVGIYIDNKSENIDVNFNILEFCKAHIFYTIFIFIVILLLSFFSINIPNIFGINIGIIILSALYISYLYLYYSSKFYSINLFKEFINVKKGVIIQTNEYALYRHIKSTHSTKNVATHIGNINLNVSGEQMQETKGKNNISLSQIFTSNSIKLNYVVKTDHILDRFDSIYLSHEVNDQELLDSKEDIKNTIFILTPFLAVLLFLFIKNMYAGIIALVLFIVISAIIIWNIKMKKYSFQQDRVIYTSGIFYKKILSIPYIRFNFIENDTGFINKISKNGNVGIFTVGSGKKELNIKNIGNYSKVYDLINKD